MVNIKLVVSLQVNICGLRKYMAWFLHNMYQISLREEPPIIDPDMVLRKKVLLWTQEDIFLDGKRKPHFLHVLYMDED